LKQTFFILFFALKLFSQPHYNVKSYNSANGFINSSIHSVVSDSANCIYFCTELGIAQYDGKEFENYTYNNGLVENIVTNCAREGDKLWYAAYKKGFYYLKDGRSYEPLKVKMLIYNFRFFKKHLLTLETNNTLNVYELNAQRFPVKKILQIPSFLMGNMHYHAGYYYFLSGEGLEELSEGTMQHSLIAKSVEPFYTSVQKNNLIYLASKGEITVFDLTSKKIVDKIVDARLKDHVNTIFVDKKDNVWLGMADKNNLWLVQNKVFFNMNHVFSSNPPMVNCFFEDIQSNIWVSTYGAGVFKLSEQKLHKINSQAGLTNEFVTSVGRKGEELLIGTNNGFFIYDYLAGKAEQVNGLSKGNAQFYVHNVQPIDENRVLLHFSSLAKESYNTSAKGSALLVNNYRCSEKMNDSLYLLGRWDGAIGLYNKKTEKVIPLPHIPNIPAGTRTHRLRKFGEGSYLMATDLGLFSLKFEGANLISQQRVNAIPETRINDILVQNGKCYVGGLGVFAELGTDLKSRSIKSISGIDLEEVEAFAISEKDQLLFVASLKGMFTIDLKTKAESRLFPDNDLPSQEVNCLLFDEKKDQLIAGTCVGVDIYDRALFDPDFNKFLRTPVVTHYYITPEKINDLHSTEISIGEKSEVLNLKVSMPNYEYTRLLKFRYEYNTETPRIYFSEKNDFSLTDIPYGESELKISATFNSHEYSPPLILKIHRETPWKNTAAGMIFITLLVVLIFVIIMIVSARLYKKREIKKLFEQANLNKLTLMAYNRTMSPHFVFNVLSNIQGLINTDNTELANDYLVSFSRLLRKSIDIIQKELIKLSEEIDFLEKYIKLEKMRFTDTLDIELINAVPSEKCEVIRIPPMLVQPLIENSFKYGFKNSFQNASIKISFEIDETNLMILVKDNGSGLSASAEKESSFGIRSIRERLNNYPGSTFTINNNLDGVGVSNEIIIPLKELKKGAKM
jgi:hypothetical protein